MSGTKFETSNLDVLRAIGVLIVFTFHLTEAIRINLGFSTPWTFYGLDADPFGRAALLLFFVHTCFVLMQSMERSDIRTGSFAREFFIRRAFRIYPLSAICVLAIVALHVPRSLHSGPFVFPGAQQLVTNLLLIQNLTHDTSITLPLWTLPYEVEMYALLPLVYATIRLQRSVSRAMLWFVSSALLVLGASLFSFRLAYILQFFPCFMAGVVAYKLTGTAGKPRLPSWGWPLFIVALIAVYGWSVRLLHFAIWSFSRRGVLTVAAVSLALGFMLPRFRHATNRPFVLVTHVLAKYSYGIYLTHMSVLWLTLIYLVGKVSLPLRLALLVFLSVTLPLACFHFVEQPMMDLGRKLTSGYRKTTRGIGVGTTA